MMRTICHAIIFALASVLGPVVQEMKSAPLLLSTPLSGLQQRFTHASQQGDSQMPEMPASFCLR
jgi:hypothetical protein